MAGCAPDLCAQLWSAVEQALKSPAAGACDDLTRIADEMRARGGSLPRSVAEVLRRFYTEQPAGGTPLGVAVTAAEERLKSVGADIRTVTNEGCYVEFLKDHSSYTPLLPATYHHCHGGGYFAALCGYGLVIDPGHRFLDNFYRAGHSIADIDGIVVTHFHDDHYADLPALLSLLRARRDRPARVNLYLDHRTHSAFSHLISGAGHLTVRRIDATGRPHPPGNGPAARQVDLGSTARVSFLPIDHSAPGFGLHLEVPTRRSSVVITSDTRWSAAIAAAYSSLARGGHRAIIAHISTAHAMELAALADCPNPLQTWHLAVAGTCQAALACAADLVVLSEIGEELASVAGDLAGQVSSAMGLACEVATKGCRLYLYHDGVCRWSAG